jgi:hypothetical protein
MKHRNFVGLGKFNKNEENPLDGDFLIVDECSMLDINLTASLLKAVPPHSQVFLSVIQISYQYKTMPDHSLKPLRYHCETCYFIKVGFISIPGFRILPNLILIYLVSQLSPNLL